MSFSELRLDKKDDNKVLNISTKKELTYVEKLDQEREFSKEKYLQKNIRGC